MQVSQLPWLVAAILALLGGLADLSRRLPAEQRRVPRALRPNRVILSALVLVLVIGGVVWRGVQRGSWPGSSAADMVALLSAGALVCGLALTHKRDERGHPAVFGINLLGVAVLVGIACLAAIGNRTGVPSLDRQSWLFGARSLLAGLGIGSWLPALIASTLFALDRSAVVEGSSAPMEMPQRGRPIDAGRLPALIGYPFLTAALIVAAMGNLQLYAAVWRTSPPELWLFVAWLLGAAYLHATSPWQPLKTPAWFATLIAAAAFGAAGLCALSAGVFQVR